MNELLESSLQIQKGGFDYPATALSLMLTCLSPLVLRLLNIMFVTEYPTMLSVSLLSVIPKIGNLRLPSNYRRIQMHPLLSNLYDKILSNRLLQWVKISPEQTAFQKGKGTIDQIFLLRLIMGLAKYYNTPLYGGFFDLSKAFDRVSRHELLCALIKMGIGSAMLEALKCMYSTTKWVLVVLC